MRDPCTCACMGSCQMTTSNSLSACLCLCPTISYSLFNPHPCQNHFRTYLFVSLFSSFFLYFLSLLVCLRLRPNLLPRLLFCLISGSPISDCISSFSNPFIVGTVFFCLFVCSFSYPIFRPSPHHTFLPLIFFFLLFFFLLRLLFHFF